MVWQPSLHAARKPVPPKGDKASHDDSDDDFVPDMPLPNLSSVEGGDRVVRRKPCASTSSRSQSFSDIPDHPAEVYPHILVSLDDQPAQDPGLQTADETSDELAQLMEASGTSSSSSSKGMLPKGTVHPSRGSEKHSSGNCQPCSFFLRGKCAVAEGCLYCHYEHDRPQRPGKKSRERAKRRQEVQRLQEELEPGATAAAGGPKKASHSLGSIASLTSHFGIPEPTPTPKSPPKATTPTRTSWQEAGVLFDGEEPPAPGVIRL